MKKHEFIKLENLLLKFTEYINSFRKMSQSDKLKIKSQKQFLDFMKKSPILSSTDTITEIVISLSGKESKKVYTKHGLLGRGGFANCYITRKEGSERFLATKVIEKANLKSNRTKMRLMNQIKIHKTFKHPNIVEFIHYFEDSCNVYIMLELCENQSLSELLKERGTFTSPEIQSFLYGICKGVRYLHHKKYIHRDLKLGNIFLNSKYQIKIGDFGLTAQLQFLRQNKRTVCGTPNYIAPEVLDGTGYYFQIDVWAIGIILFTLFFGYPPFESQQTPEIYKRIRNCDYYFPKKPIIPKQAEILIKSILIPDPLKRPTIDEILNSSFMNMGRGALLQLPETTYMCSIGKKQLQTYPVASLVSQTLYSQPFEMESTRMTEKQKVKIDKSFTRDESMPQLGRIQEQKYQEMKEKQKKVKKIPDLFLLDLNLISEKVYFFRTSQDVFGIYEEGKEICFRHYSAFLKNQPTITQLPIFQNLFGETSKIDFNTYKFKSILSFKAKEFGKELLTQQDVSEKIQEMPLVQEKQKKIGYLIKMTKFKAILLARLSNKSFQMVFEESGDGFIYESKSQKLFYFDDSLLKSNKNYSIKEVKVDSLYKTVTNFLNQSKNNSKLPNILSNINLMDGKSLKLSMLKLKNIYAFIEEVRTKTTKHCKNRHSQ